MKPLFSPIRFAQFLRWEVLGNPRNYLYWFCAIFLISLLALQMLSIPLYGDHYQTGMPYYLGADKIGAQVRLYFMGLLYLLFLTLAPSYIKHATLTDKAKRMEQLMLPVSALERYVAQWLICTVGCTLIFITAFILADLVNLFLLSLYFPLMEGFQPVPVGYLFGIGTDEWGIIRTNHFYNSGGVLFSSFLLLQSIYFFTSYFWSKRSFIKTSLILVAFVIAFVATFVYTPCLKDLLLQDNSDTLLLETIGWSGAHYIAALYFLALGYGRLREAESIPRW
ncbi:membrane protein [gut metagenome]|uniref:Membrane protein n=1 Tax=gut metagenome TaxID=749906 RepID=J9FRT0_9ZZZZ